jgi:hypothetical protein
LQQPTVDHLVLKINVLGSVNGGDPGNVRRTQSFHLHDHAACRFLLPRLCHFAVWPSATRGLLSNER